MADDGTSAPARPRGRLKAGIERKRTLHRRQLAMILNRRAEGQKPDRIARDMGLPIADVDRAIRDGRALGDKRALTNHEAVTAAARVAAGRVAGFSAIPSIAGPVLREPVAAPAVAPAPPKRRIEPVRRVTFAPADAGKKEGYILRLRDMADMCRVGSRDRPPHAVAAAGMDHLADLFEHCPTAYPDYLCTGGGFATLESTDRKFPRLGPARSVHSSPFALCADAG